MKRRASVPWAGRAGLRDVAQQAGVSTATVSRLINEPDRVSHEVGERVRAAMKALGYVPNFAAKTLRLRRSRMIGIIVPTLSHALYATLVESLESELRREHHCLVVATCDYDGGREEEQVRRLIERGTDALVLVGEDRSEELYEVLTQHRIPFVCTYVFQEGSTRPCIGFDNARAAADATTFLLDRGHTRIGMIAGISFGNDRVRARIDGFRAALGGRKEAQLDGPVLECPYTIDDGRQGARKLLERFPDLTGLVCANDVLALGALLECQSAGIEVPGRISIVGMDDLEFAAHVAPGLTTISVPARAMGQETAQYLLARLAGAQTAERHRIPAPLIERGTTARIGKPLSQISRMRRLTRKSRGLSTTLRGDQP